MSDLNKLKLIVHNLDTIIAGSPELRRRLAEIEARAKVEEAEQLADELETAYQVEMNQRMRWQS